jgi:ATP-dependent 26S proteasome regulatory subunit
MRARIRGRLEELGRLVDTPFEWDDLVLPDPVADALRDIAFEAAHREGAIASDGARRLYGRPGLAAMFSGPPGTGKTMAAQVVARVLGRDLLVVDTATTQSKFIGDTAKNLKRIFNGVRGCPVVVLFDEADAFFAKRTEVRDSNDRYANADTNYLLQLVEDFDGVVILATNQRTNIDYAFVRRLRHVIEFPRPDAQHRIALWHRYLGTVAGADAVHGLGALVASVAADVELSPAQIKGASLSARLAAMRSGGPLDAAAFIKGIERELAKEGRSLGPRDRERILVA